LHPVCRIGHPVAVQDLVCFPRRLRLNGRAPHPHWQVTLVLIVVLGWPVCASAQWYGAAYLGANHTQSADVHIDQPDRATSLVVQNVAFEARPLVSPQYYGLRGGRLFGATRKWGLEVEFIHLKVISRTDRPYTMSGEWQGAPVDGTERMDVFVQRYSMTHGLNYLLLNVVARQPLAGGAVALTGRAGGGPTYPHAESTVGGAAREQYEAAGFGLHAAGGLDVRLVAALSAFVEYKLTAARPEIDVAGGTGHVRTIDHQIAAGLAFGWPR
jgi:hypothetical protein